MFTAYTLYLTGSSTNKEIINMQKESVVKKKKRKSDDVKRKNVAEAKCYKFLCILV